MDSSEKHTDTLYSVSAFLILCISLGVGVYFYFSQKDVKENKQTMVLPMTQKVDSSLQPDISPEPSQTIPAEASMMKIAIPTDITAVLVDHQGRQTGTLDKKTLNEIPLSEFVPDAIAGTVGWIIVEDPSEEGYTLDVQGISDKSIAVYAKNAEGREDLELIETAAKQSFSIRFDPTSAEHMLSVD